MINEDVELVFRLIDVGETGKIDKRALTDWVVRPFILCISSIDSIIFMELCTCA